MSCKCSCPCSSSSCHQHPSRHPMSIMLETWLLFRQAISVEAAFSWAKPLNHNLSVPPLSLQGKCSTYQSLKEKTWYMNKIVKKSIKYSERGEHWWLVTLLDFFFFLNVWEIFSQISVLKIKRDGTYFQICSCDEYRRWEPSCRIFFTHLFYFPISPWLYMPTV